MALIKCSECGKEISDKAVSCPNCGTKVITNQSKKDVAEKMDTDSKKALYAIIGTIILLLGLGMILNNISNNTITTSTEYSSTSKSTSTKSQTKTYNLGTTARVGDWEITVVNAEDKKTLKDSFGTKTTENNYIVVKLKIKNMSNEARSLLTYGTETTDNAYHAYARSILELYDGKSTYIADYGLEDYADNDFDMMFSKINPNTTITYNAVFETGLPSSQKEYKLKLNDNDKVFFKIK